MKKLVLIILLIFSLTVVFTNVKEINIVSEEWEDATNKDGSGFYWELIKLVYEPVGIKVNYSIAPYARGVNGVKSGKFDAWVGSYADEEEFAIYPNNEMDTDNVSAVFLKETIPNWKGKESLKGKTLSWIRGYGYDEYIDFEVKFEEVDKRESALKMILGKRVDVFMDASVEINNALEEGEFSKDKFNIENILSLKLYVAFGETEKGKELLKIWDERIEKLKSSGELRKLYEKSGYTDYPFLDPDYFSPIFAGSLCKKNL